MFLENSIQSAPLRAVVVFFLIFLGLRILFFILGKVLFKAASKTKTELDDKILEKSSYPLTLIVFFISLRVVFSQIELGISEFLMNVISNLIDSMLIIIGGYLIYVILDLIIERAFKGFIQRTKSKMDDSLFSLANNVLKTALILLIFLYVLSVWGIEILPVLGALGVAGIAVALALQPVLSNVFSGASMILDKSVSKGDLVYLDAQTKGKIAKVGMRSTKLITFDNELIIVPNTKLAESVIQNVALPEPMSRVVIPFSVAYGSKVELVKKVVLKEIETVNNLFKDKDHEPSVRFLEMGESSLNFKAYFYVDTYEERFKAIDDINTKIYNALNKAGIEIPFPQMDVHLKK